MEKETDFASQVFEVVITYAVDDPRRTTDDTTLLDELQLDETKFCTELYADRPGSTQTELEKYVLKGSHVVLVYGFPGTGKTSLVFKALHSLTTNPHAPRILQFRIDFKALELHEQLEIEKDIRKCVDEALMHMAKLLAMEIGADERSVVMALLSPEAKKHQVSNSFQDLRFKLFGEYKAPKASGDFASWVRSNIDDSKVDKLVSAMAGCLTVKDYLYYFTSQNKESPNLCVLVFDNMDSVISNDARDTFYTYIRNLHAWLGSSVRIVAVGRTTNLVKEQLSDYGTYLIDDIAVDYSEFLDEKEFQKACERCAAGKGYCSEFDKMNIRDRLESDAKRRFARSITEKRTKYLDKISDTSFSRTVNPHNMARIREFYDLAMSNEHIYASTLELANLNRREMLMHISNFVRYITERLELRPTELGTDDEERRFVLESYFYHWINDKDQIAGLGVYDLVRDWKEWCSAGNDLGCSLTHLIIATIYNLTGRVRGKHSHIPRTTIAHVTERLFALGYDPSVTMQRIFDIYKRGDTYMGMLETGQFFQIKSIQDLKSSDAIWLTPRAANICKYLSFKLLFMLSSLRKNHFQIGNEEFNYDDGNPITVQSLTANLAFLCCMAEMHMKALVEIKKRLGRKAEGDWLRHYRRYFCVGVDGESDGEGYGNLLFHNIIRSHIKFLKHQGEIALWSFIDQENIANRYECLLRAFDSDLELLSKGDLDISTIDTLRYRSACQIETLHKLREVTR